jgi:hypothetical protein
MVVADSGAEAAPDEEGELVHAGPLVAQGYWQDTAHRRTLSPRAGVLRAGGMAVWSGDRVRRDAEGLLHFVGRRDAMIKTSGNRVSPQEVEEAAVATGLVAEAVALGLPDPHLGHAIHLVARPAVAPEKAEAELLPALTRALPNFMVPRLSTGGRTCRSAPTASWTAWRWPPNSRAEIRMKPLGPIPPGFAAIDGELAIAGRKASDLRRRRGIPRCSSMRANCSTGRWPGCAPRCRSGWRSTMR